MAPQSLVTGGYDLGNPREGWVLKVTLYCPGQGTDCGTTGSTCVRTIRARIVRTYRVDFVHAGACSSSLTRMAVELVREACNCTHEEALTLLASTDGNVDEAVHAFVDQEKVEQGMRVRTQKQVARKRARLEHGDNTAGRVVGPPPRRSKRADRDIRRRDLQWANWELQTALSHHDAKFDVHAGEPLKITAPYVPPGVSWRGVNAVLSHLYVGERDHAWVPAQVATDLAIAALDRISLVRRRQGAPRGAAPPREPSSSSEASASAGRAPAPLDACALT